MSSLKWEKVKKENGVEQFDYYDEDLEVGLMMLPTDIALRDDPHFSTWVKKYADDKESFFEDFAAVFAKLVELGIQRNEQGRITNVDNQKGGYHAAPKKKREPGSPGKSSDDSVDVDEAGPLAKKNDKFRARL